MFKLQILFIFNFDWAHQSWISGVLGVKSSKGLLLQNFCQTCLVLLMNSGVKVTCPKYTVSSSKKSWMKNVIFKSNQRLSVNFIIWTYRVRQIFVAEIICLIKTVIFSSIARKTFPFLSVFTIKINMYNFDFTLFF